MELGVLLFSLALTVLTGIVFISLALYLMAAAVLGYWWCVRKIKYRRLRSTLSTYRSYMNTESTSPLAGLSSLSKSDESRESSKTVTKS